MGESKDSSFEPGGSILKWVNPENRVLNPEARFRSSIAILPWCPNQEASYLEQTLSPPSMLGKMNETNDTTTDVIQNK